MAIECNQCKHENPDDSRYCGRCGEQLPIKAVPQTINESDVNEQTRIFVSQFADRIKLEAAQIKMEALEDFQDRATRWVKIQFVTATVAISLLLAFLALLGYSGWDLKVEFQKELTLGIDEIVKGKTEIETIKDEYQMAIDKSEQELENAKIEYQAKVRENLKIVTDSSTKLEGISQSVTSKATNALQLIEKKQLELENFNFGQIESYRNELREEKNNISVLTAGINRQIAKLDKIERSRYQILVHYGGLDLERSEPANFNELQTVLYEKGYIVDYEDIMNVSADRQEILYYSATTDMDAKVEEIRGLISPEVDGEVGKKLERSSNNDPFQIVIKLCPKGTAGGLACKL